MITRILESSEYPRLAGTELEAVWPHLPAGAHVLIVEDGDRILACWALYPQYHVEGVWIAPAARGNARVGRRLLLGMRQLAAAVGARTVLTAATSDDVAAMIERMGGSELPGRHFVLASTQ